jgi:hypothetical protein
VRLFTRNGHDWTDRYPLIAEAASKNRSSSFVLDGEAVLLGVDGMSDFDGLHSGRHDDEVQLYAFDCLVLDGDDLRKLPLSMRKTNLARLLARRPDGIYVAPRRRVAELANGEEPPRTGSRKRWRPSPAAAGLSFVSGCPDPIQPAMADALGLGLPNRFEFDASKVETELFLATGDPVPRRSIRRVSCSLCQTLRCFPFKLPILHRWVTKNPQFSRLSCRAAPVAGASRRRLPTDHRVKFGVRQQNGFALGVLDRVHLHLS